MATKKWDNSNLNATYYNVNCAIDIFISINYYFTTNNRETFGHNFRSFFIRCFFLKRLPKLVKQVITQFFNDNKNSLFSAGLYAACVCCVLEMVERSNLTAGDKFT